MPLFCYPLSRIESLLYRMGTDSEAWEKIKTLSDHDTKKRLVGIASGGGGGGDDED